MGNAGAVVRVLPDAGALDKQFDYLVPHAGAALVEVGTMVRVELAGRRVGGWVTGVDVEPPQGVALRPLAHVRGLGPDAVMVDLAQWAAWRWAGRTAALLSTASPVLAVTALPAAALRPPAPPTSLPVALDRLGVGAATVLPLGPAVDLTPVVAALAQLGPALVVLPSASRVAVLADRLRRAGADVAVVPDGWAQARAGAAVVIGTRSAAWAPCPGLAVVVVVDGHDDALVQEQAPTWSALGVAVERARRARVPCVVTSPCPTVSLLAVAGEVRRPVPAAGPGGWAPLQVVDMRSEDPRAGLWSAPVVHLARTGGRVVVVLNRTGRARLLTCGSCKDTARCERCGAAVATVAGPDGAEHLECPRCAVIRPVVCATCGSSALRRLRIGVSRAREQLEALALRPVGEVTAATEVLPAAEVLVGTEAVLHRVTRADAVALVDLDSQLLAPRYRAPEEALAVLARAARLVGGRRHPGARVVVQTRQPDHPVIQAAQRGDPGRVSDVEAPLRRSLRLPPAAAVAVLSGPVAPRYAASLQGLEVMETGDGRIVVRADDAATLADALAEAPRPPGRLRVEVDPLTV